MSKLRRLKIYFNPQRRELVISGNGNYFTRLLLFRIETSDKKHEEINILRSSLFRRDPKDFEMPLLAIFNYKHCRGLFRTKIFFGDVFG